MHALHFHICDRWAQAAELLPEGCELTDVPIAQLVFARYPFSTVGTYNEVSQTLLFRYRGQVYTDAVRLHVDNPAAMYAGREIGGFPSKRHPTPLLTARGPCPVSG